MQRSEPHKLGIRIVSVYLLNCDVHYALVVLKLVIRWK